jgi:hypothetical protein
VWETSIEVLSIEGGGEDEGGVGGIEEMAGGFRFRFGELNCAGLILRSIVGEGRGFNIELDARERESGCGTVMQLRLQVVGIQPEVRRDRRIGWEYTRRLPS